MSRVLTAIALFLTLAACEPLPYTQSGPVYYTPPPAAPNAVETAQAPDAYSPDFDTSSDAGADLSTQVTVTGAVAATDVAAATGALPPPEGPMLAQQRAACEREGGRLTPRGAGLFVCLHQTSDAGRQCDSAASCEGACLARSRTCAPMRPLLGCQEVFTLPGRRETLCTD